MLFSLIKRGESEVVEFKSLLRYDFANNGANKDLGRVIAKTVSGFMNSDGGYLCIGISDNGEPIGIQNDIDILWKKTYDAFLAALFQLVIDYIGKEYCQKIHPSLTEINKIKVCVVKIERCNKPAWFKDRDVQTFYIRVGQSTRPLEAKETVEYILHRF